MTRQQKKYLFDILQSIRDIREVHLKGIDSEKSFCTDLKTIRAVERELAIIGEAAYQLSKLSIHCLGKIKPLTEGIHLFINTMQLGPQTCGTLLPTGYRI